MMYAKINRFEGDFAVCEVNGKDIVSIERTFVPSEAKVGSSFVLGDKIKIAIQETVRHKKSIE